MVPSVIIALFAILLSNSCINGKGLSKLPSGATNQANGPNVLLPSIAQDDQGSVGENDDGAVYIEAPPGFQERDRSQPYSYNGPAVAAGGVESSEKDDGEFENMPANFGGEENFIINGRMQMIRDVNHAVQIFVEVNDEDRGTTSLRFICSGTIVKEDKVVTAAHCLEDRAAKYFIISGAFLRIRLPTPWRQVREVSSLAIHPMFNAEIPYDNDLAVLTLATDLEYTRFTGQIEIAGRNSRTGQFCRVNGWGTTRTGPGFQINSLWLRTARMPTINNFWCNKIWERKIDEGIFDKTVNKKHICTRDFRQGPCSGDGGAGLICRGKLAGVVSWGNSNCARNLYPDVYTRLSEFSTWLALQL